MDPDVLERRCQRCPAFHRYLVQQRAGGCRAPIALPRYPPWRNKPSLLLTSRRKQNGVGHRHSPDPSHRRRARPPAFARDDLHSLLARCSRPRCRVGVLEILPRAWLVARDHKKFTWPRPLRVRLILRGGCDERAKAAQEL